MLEKYKRDIYLCGNCGLCQEMYSSFRKVYKVCPVREKLRWLSYTGRGRMAIARGILEKVFTYSDPLIEHIYTDLLCGMCTTHCPSEINKFPIFKAMRADIVAQGLKIPEGVERLATNVQKEHNIFAAPKDERGKWAEGMEISGKADLVYFAGCVASYKHKEIAKSVAKILKAVGVEFAVLKGDEWCCGNRLFLNGHVSLAKGMAAHNVMTLEKMGARQVVFSCPEGYRAFKQEYPVALGRELKFQVIHVSELLAQLLENRKIKFGKGFNEVLTYHDPCALGRLSKVYDQPRMVLGAIPGVELKEMLRNKEAAWCCGAGQGIVNAANPDLAIDIAGDMLEEALSVNAKRIVTSCPTCKWIIEEAINRQSSGMKVSDFTEIVAAGMGL